jgi:hypothetical protein
MRIGDALDRRAGLGKQFLRGSRLGTIHIERAPERAFEIGGRQTSAQYMSAWLGCSVSRPVRSSGPPDATNSIQPPTACRRRAPHTPCRVLFRPGLERFSCKRTIARHALLLLA